MLDDNKTMDTLTCFFLLCMICYLNYFSIFINLVKKFIYWQNKTWAMKWNMYYANYSLNCALLCCSDETKKYKWNGKTKSNLCPRWHLPQWESIERIVSCKCDGFYCLLHTPWWWLEVNYVSISSSMVGSAMFKWNVARDVFEY